MTKMKFTPADNLVDDVWGKVGTPERDVMEAQLKDEVGVSPTFTTNVTLRLYFHRNIHKLNL